MFEEARKAAKRRCPFYWVLIDEKDSSGSKGGSVCSVTQSCLILCDCMDCSLPARLLCPWGFFRQEYWSGLPCLPPGDLPNSGIGLGSPTLQVDSLPSELPGK